MAASRLEVVLRAGQEREESGLTRALKKTSLVPTGACLPRNFDPDYCAYDRYYTDRRGARVDHDRRDHQFKRAAARRKSGGHEPSGRVGPLLPHAQAWLVVR